jgi:uncharacterized protein YndB with AHSA1/START domain
MLEDFLMNKVICLSARLHCTTSRAFEMFTFNTQLESWLTVIADVEPVLGGKYELFWNPANREINSTLGCKVIAIEPDKFLSFEWKGPPQFKHFMNNADPLTSVVVFFIPCNEVLTPCTDVYLIHSGWGSSAEWEEARQYFVRAWTHAFDELERQVNG